MKKITISIILILVLFMSLSVNALADNTLQATFESDNDSTYTLYATFSYVTGVSSVCTDAYYEQTIYQGNWTFSNGSATKSGNTARGTGNYIKKFLFITAKDIDIDLTMTCDKYGNVT